MKKHIFLLLLSYVFVKVNAQIDDVIIVKGPIKEMKVSVYNSNNGAKIDKDYLGGFQLYSYDTNSKLVNLTYFDKNGKRENIELYKYDKVGNLIEIEYLNKDSFLVSKEIKKYDNDGNLIELTNYNDNGFNYKFHYKYKNNKVIEEISVSETGKMINKVVNMYDNNNNLMVRKAFGSSMEFPAEVIDSFQYDDKKNMISYTRNKLKDGLINRTVYTYDNKGNKVEEKNYAKDGNLKSRKVMEYNDMGHVVRQTSYDGMGEINIFEGWAYEYLEYDKYGNWCQRNDVSYGIKSTIVTRTIKYQLKK